jgi:predicted GIY-YIG superfamily endonuclease
LKWLYVVRNNISGKEYIGVSIDPERRWSQHKRMATNCGALKDAMKKYGVDNFTFKVLCSGEDTYIDELEIKGIEKFNTQVPNGYNLTLGGDGTNYTKWDDEWNSLLGTKPDQELADELGVGYGVVNRRRRGLNIQSFKVSSMNTPWEDYIHLLGTMSDPDLAKIIDISPNTVQVKRKMLKIKPYEPQKPRYDYPEELINLLGTLPDTTLSGMFNIPFSAVNQKRKSLGIARFKNNSIGD